MKKLLLNSNSVAFGSGFMDHVMTDLGKFLGPVNQVVFVPYASNDWDGYTSVVRNRFAKAGINVTGLNESDPTALLSQAQAIFVGGGNTFRLLKTLQDQKVLRLIRKRVLAGVPYIGSSAGSNLAGPTIRTTNDMPIVEPKGFAALGLVPFQINPHYLDPDPTSRHMGETRETRIKEFLEENDVPVVGLREGAWIIVENETATIHGKGGARLFQRGNESREVNSGEQIT